MAHNAKYGVKFVGYSAYVVRKGHEGEYAVLDFVTERIRLCGLRVGQFQACRSWRIRPESSNTQH
jgi:hypothetical protein